MVEQELQNGNTHYWEQANATFRVLLDPVALRSRVRKSLSSHGRYITLIYPYPPKLLLKSIKVTGQTGYYLYVNSTD